MRICFFSIFWVVSVIPGDDMTMLENNYHHAGLLVIRPEDSTWKGWSNPKYMVVQDSSGEIYSFTPPLNNDRDQTNTQMVKGERQEGSSIKDGDSPAAGVNLGREEKDSTWKESCG